MPTLVGFGTFAALPEEQISEKISRLWVCVYMINNGLVTWLPNSVQAGV